MHFTNFNSCNYSSVISSGSRSSNFTDDLTMVAILFSDLTRLGNLIEALFLLQHDLNHLVLTLVLGIGEGAYYPFLKRLILELGFLGYLSS